MLIYRYAKLDLLLPTLQLLRYDPQHPVGGTVIRTPDRYLGSFMAGRPRNRSA
jgi:hypothetical protein